MRESCANAKAIKSKEDNKNTEIYDRLVKLEKENAELKKDVKYLKSSKPSRIVNNNTINGDLNINTGTVNNITVVAYGKENMGAIDREDIIKALKTGFNSTKHLTEVVHFNPKYPNYSNIRRSNFNMKNKLMFHNGHRWVTTSDPNMIDDLYNRKRDFIEENIDHYRDGLTKGDMTRLNRWLSVEDDDCRIAKIKDELRELLFNRKDISEMNEKHMSIETADPNEIDADEYIDLDDEIQHRAVPTKIIPKVKGKKKHVASRNGRYRKVVARRAR
jgi:hypothetical protein